METPSTTSKQWEFTEGMHIVLREIRSWGNSGRAVPEKDPIWKGIWDHGLGHVPSPWQSECGGLTLVFSIHTQAPSSAVFTSDIRNLSSCWLIRVLVCLTRLSPQSCQFLPTLLKHLFLQPDVLSLPVSASIIEALIFLVCISQFKFYGYTETGVIHLVALSKETVFIWETLFRADQFLLLFSCSVVSDSLWPHGL